MAQVCAGLTSGDGKWKVKDQLTLVTDYVVKSQDEGYGEIRNTLTLEHGPVGLYYSFEKAHQGDESVKTHEVGITFKRKSKSAN
jgi:hypothetical protein